MRRLCLCPCSHCDYASMQTTRMREYVSVGRMRVYNYYSLVNWHKFASSLPTRVRTVLANFKANREPNSRSKSTYTALSLAYILRDPCFRLGFISVQIGLGLFFYFCIYTSIEQQTQPIERMRNFLQQHDQYTECKCINFVLICEHSLSLSLSHREANAIIA